MKNEGGFVAAGYSTSFGAGGNDAYIVSMRSDGTYCQQDNNVTPNAGAPQTEIGTPQTISTDINYETVTALFNSADFNIAQNTQCLTGP
jgi:hypothetical protein